MAQLHRPSAIILVLLAGLSPPLLADEMVTEWLPTIEVFTTADRPILRIDAFLEQNPDATLHIHRVDTIEILEDELSVGLSLRSENARRKALQRLQQLSPERRVQLEHTAKALVAASRLGVRKVPAVVFDRSTVIYGITDLPHALNFYRAWQIEATQ